MSTIPDSSGEPISKWRKPLRAIRIHFRDHWSKWLSVIALGVACWSATTAHKASDLSRTLAKLDFRPDVRIHSRFQDIARFPPHVSLTNIGPVDAVQVTVKMYSHRYFPSLGKISFTLECSENNAFFERIEPRGREVVKFREGWLDSNARVQVPPQHNILEIRIEYRRDQDLEAFNFSAFYYVNSDGRWVSETDSSLREPIYHTLKEAANDHSSSFPQYFLGRYEEGDVLHKNDIP